MIESIKSANKDKLFATLIGVLTVLYLLFVSVKGSMSGVGMGGMFIAAAALLFSEKGEKLKHHSPSTISMFGGVGLLILLLATMLFLWQWEYLNYYGHPERMFPFFALIACMMIIYGYTSVRHFVQEFLILIALGLPPIILFYFASAVSYLTARTAAMVLWYFGVNAAVSDRTVYIPGGAVKVSDECSGYILDAWLIGIAVVAMVVMPLKNRALYLILPVVALTIGVITNTIRVAGLALLSRADNTEQFDYWHLHDGSQIFGLFGIGLFVTLYWLLLKQQDRHEEEQKRRSEESLEYRLRQ